MATLTTAKFNKYGAVTFTVTDATVTTRTSDSEEITFYPKDFSLSISEPPASRTFYYTNETFDLTVVARDEDGETVTNYNGLVNISASGISGLSSTYTFTCSGEGTHTFNDIYGGSATTTANITITDAVNTNVTGTLSANITIRAGTLKVTSKSGPVGTNAITVAMYDSSGAIIEDDDSTTFTVTLSESNNDNSSTSTATITATTLTNGQATIYIANNQAETITITPVLGSPSSADITLTSGTLTIGTLGGSGISVDMWREVK